MIALLTVVTYLPYFFTVGLHASGGLKFVP